VLNKSSVSNALEYLMLALILQEYEVLRKFQS